MLVYLYLSKPPYPALETGRNHSFFRFLKNLTDEFPGWPLRNLLVLVASKFGRRKLASTKSPLTVVCLRQKSFPGGKICIGHSIIVQIRLNGDAALIDEPIFKGNTVSIPIPD
jgi:hypothetical protein